MADEAALSRSSLPQVLQRTIGGYQAALSTGVAIQNDLEQIVRSLFRDLLAWKQVVNDQQVGFGESLVTFFLRLS